MPTTTTTYSFNKPVVGADEDDWGGYLNGNWDSVDDLLDGTTPVTGIDINSGTLDGVTIGGTTAGAGTFTTLTANTSITGTLATAAQPNITSVGSLTSLDVAGTLTSDGLTVDGGLTLNADLDVAEVKFQSTANAKVKIVSSTTANSILMLGDTDDNDIGMIDYDNANNSMRFVTNTSEAMRIDSSGNVGIGTASPNNYSANHRSITLNAPTTPLIDLEVNGTRTGSFVANSTNVDLNAVTSVPIRFLTADTERMRIDSSGNVGIGTSSPDVFSRGYTRTVGISSSGSTSLAIQSASDPQYPAIEMGRGSSRQFLITNQAAYSTIGTLENTPLRFVTNSSEAMRIDSSGNLLVGSTDTTPYDNTSGNAIRMGDGLITSAQEGGNAAIFNRMLSDGSIVQFRKDGTTVGSIGSYSGVGMYAMAPNNGGSGLLFYDNAAPIYPIKNVSGSATIGDAYTDLGAAVHRFKDLYLSGGVYLGGTGSANKLTDVEYGTAIVSLWGTTNPATQVTATLYYTKVNDQVTFQVGFESVDTTGYAGDMRITGLPIANTSGSRCPVNIILYNAGTWSDTLVGIISGGSTTIDVMNARSGNTWSTVTHSAGTSRYIWASGSYKN